MPWDVDVQVYRARKIIVLKVFTKIRKKRKIKVNHFSPVRPPARLAWSHQEEFFCRSRRADTVFKRGNVKLRNTFLGRYNDDRNDLLPVVWRSCILQNGRQSFAAKKYINNDLRRVWNWSTLWPWITSRIWKAFKIVQCFMLSWDWTLHLLHLDRPLNRPLLLKWISEPEKVGHFCFVFNTVRAFWKQDDELYLVVALNLLVWNPLKVPRPFANAIRSYRHLHLGKMIVKASYNHHLKSFNH